MLRKSLIISVFLLILLYISGSAMAQNVEIQDLTDDDYLQLQLPPLAVLFENAKQSAAVQYYDTQKKVQESMLKTAKRDWLKYIKAIAGYQYGNIGVNATFTDPNTPVVNQFSSSTQSMYNIGIVFTIPFDDLFDRSNRVHRQKLAMKSTEAETGKWYEEQKIRIIESYTNAMLFMSVLKAKAETMTLAEAQYEIAKSEFVNGKIDAADLSARKSIQTDAFATYEQTKSALNMALLQLEVLSHTQILNK